VLRHTFVLRTCAHVVQNGTRHACTRRCNYATPASYARRAADSDPALPRIRLARYSSHLDANRRDSRDEKTRNDKNRRKRARERDESREITRCRNCAAPFIRAKLEKRHWILGFPPTTVPCEILTVPFIKMQRWHVFVTTACLILHFIFRNWRNVTFVVSVSREIASSVRPSVRDVLHRTEHVRCFHSPIFCVEEVFILFREPLWRFRRRAVIRDERISRLCRLDHHLVSCSAISISFSSTVIPSKALC